MLLFSLFLSLRLRLSLDLELFELFDDLLEEKEELALARLTNDVDFSVEVYVWCASVSWWSELLELEEDDFDEEREHSEEEEEDDEVVEEEMEEDEEEEDEVVEEEMEEDEEEFSDSETIGEGASECVEFVDVMGEGDGEGIKYTSIMFCSRRCLKRFRLFWELE